MPHRLLFHFVQNCSEIVSKEEKWSDSDFSFFFFSLKKSTNKGTQRGFSVGKRINKRQVVFCIIHQTMFIQTTSQLPSVQNDVLTGQYAGLRLYSCNCNTVHFRYARLFLSVQFYFIFLFLSLLFIPPFILFIYYYAFIIFFFFTFFFLPILFVVALCLALCFSSCFHQETTATCIFLFFFLMDREIYHTLCIVYYNNHYV